MGDFIGATFWIFVLATIFYLTEGCAEESWKAAVIRDKGFCVEASSSGQTFKKCYELKESK